MSSTNQMGKRAGVLGLILGCVPAVWLAGLVAGQPVSTTPPVPPAERPAPVPPALIAGQQSAQLGQAVVPQAQQELRSRFPFASLAERLAYEKAGRPAPAEKEAATRLTEESGKRLTALEDGMESRRLNARTLGLMELHTDPVPQLLPSPSGGVVFGMYGGAGMLGGQVGQSNGLIGQFGTARLTREALELPKAPDISFEAVLGTTPGDGGAAPPSPDAARLAALQTNGLFDFLDPAGFGYVKDREHVAGFEPHQFRHMPEMPAEAAAPLEKWAVVRLELVSLLGRNRPAVFASAVLPNLADVRRADARPPTPFELKALKAIREGDDMATESSGDRTRMVGSVRAGKQCLACHQVKRGDLLGAFTWELQRQLVKEDRAP